MPLHLDENTEERTPLKFVLGHAPTHHRFEGRGKNRKHLVTWNGVTYEIPHNIVIPEYILVFEDSVIFEDIEFLSTLRFGIDIPEDEYKKLIGETWDYDAIKKWCDNETEKALSKLIKV